MPDMRLAVCSRRAVVKTEFGVAFVLGNALFKDMLLLPEFKDFLFASYEIEIGFNWFVHPDS